MRESVGHSLDGVSTESFRLGSVMGFLFHVFVLEEIGLGSGAYRS
jgi:hypothetical protein